MLHFLIQTSFGLDVLGSYFSPPFDSFGRQWIVVRVHFLARAQYLWPCWFWLTYHDYFHLTSLKVVKASFFPQLQHLVQNAISGPQSELKPHIYQLCFSSPPPHSYAVNRSLLLGIRRSHRQGVAIRSEYIVFLTSLSKLACLVEDEGGTRRDTSKRQIKHLTFKNFEFKLWNLYSMLIQVSMLISRKTFLLHHRNVCPFKYHLEVKLHTS